MPDAPASESGVADPTPVSAQLSATAADTPRSVAEYDALMDLLRGAASRRVPAVPADPAVPGNASTPV